MTILVTGGTGRTGGAVAKLLSEANIPYLILNRSGAAPGISEDKICRFDFTDSSTYNLPFDKASKASSPVEAIFIVIDMRENDEIHHSVNAFIDFAVTKGVKRFVLLSSTVYHPPTRIAGAVHQYLMDNVDKLEYVILQPTWYMENFNRSHVPSIKGKGIIASASEDGPARWISTDDVGAAAFRALTDTSLKNSAHALLGPELLTYDDIARILSEVTGKQITHARISLDQAKSAYEGAGLPKYSVQIMLDLQEEMARGEENVADNGEVLRLTGNAPVTFRDWAEKHKAIWQ